jgi:general secretion pathway protein D
MKRLLRIAGAVSLLALSFTLLAVAADQAAKAYKLGVDAESRNDYIKAYEEYKQAYDLKPKEIKYRAAYTRIRFYASSELVHEGILLRKQGKLQDALVLFQRAATIDPSNFAAEQEVNRTQHELETQGNPKPTAQSESVISRMAANAGGPVELKPISNTPITLRMTEDSKVVYTTIGKLAGINVLFDPDYTSRRISIELNNVSLDQALEIVALESKTFYRPVTENTIFVAADTPGKRKELEQSVVKTFYLANVSSPNDLQDSVNAVRQITNINSIIQIQSQNAIVVRGTPDQVALAERILSDIDKSKPEVVVEVVVMQVNKDKVRTLGLQPPQTATVQLQSNTTTTSSTTVQGNSGTGGTATTTTGSGSLTLNQLAHLNATDFVVNIPTATASFLFSDNNTKIIQNPQIRAVDNQKATLKIGERVPVATGSFQPGIGGVGINPLVNTQFQYLDVGVNMDITPRIHNNGDVTLKVVLEISSVTGNTNIGGINQPIIGQRRIEHEIRLREGEISIMGGMLEDQQIDNVNGWPFLAKVPGLRYLFSSVDKETHTTETVFALIPRIVRLPDITAANLQPISVGTANAVDLRRVSELMPPMQPTGTPVAMPAPAAATPPSTPPGGAAPASPNTPSASVPQGNMATGTGIMSFEPATINQQVGSTFMVNLSLGGASNVFSVPVEVSYDHNVLQLLNVSDGGTLGKDGQPVTLVHREDPTNGNLQITATRPPGSGGVAAQGPVFTLTFAAKAPGNSQLVITRGTARDPNMQLIPLAGSQAMITVTK